MYEDEKKRNEKRGRQQREGNRGNRRKTYIDKEGK